MSDIGNELHRIVDLARDNLFRIGQSAQLTYMAFNFSIQAVEGSDHPEYDFAQPVGYKADRTVMNSTVKWTKQELLDRYYRVRNQELFLNHLIQLVTAIEAMLADVIRRIAYVYPAKMGAKRMVNAQTILAAASIEEVRLRATDAYVHELMYMAPAELAKAIEELISVSPMECSAYHKYLEIKAARDIHIHNGGIANEVYQRKAGSHARVKPGMTIPVDEIYFLESYEYCLQFSEWMRETLHSKWHSSSYAYSQNPQLALPQISSTPPPTLSDEKSD